LKTQIEVSVSEKTEQDQDMQPKSDTQKSTRDQAFPHAQPNPAQ